MDELTNQFKRSLKKGDTNIGMWLGMANSYSAEVCAGAGFDWLVIDLEHAPNTLQTLVTQLQALAPYNVAPVIRPAWNDSVQIKQIIDTGAQNLLMPMIQTKEEAIQAVAAVKYPPEGIRGVGSALARSSKWNRIPNYLKRANDEMCVIAQIETPLAAKNVTEILQVEGIDAIFIGPADLSANMGHIGNPKHPDVMQAIEEIIEAAKRENKPVGILYADEEMAKYYIEKGATLVAVGVDTTLLARSSENLAAKFKTQTPNHNKESGPY